MTNMNTYKGTAIALGIGLAALWIAGLSSPYAPGWFTWLDGLAALGSFTIAGTMKLSDTRGKRMGGPLALAAGLYVLWIIGLATTAVSWLSWWTFAFASAFLVFGVTIGGTRTFPETEEKPTIPSEPFEEPGQDRFRKTG